MKKLKAAILDIDGTLVASNEAHAHAFVQAAEEMSLEADFETILRLIGMGGDKLIPEAFGFEQESPRGEELSERKGDIFRDSYLPDLQPTPGARPLVERLKEMGLRLVVATSASEEDLKGLLSRAGVDDLIEEVTSPADVKESKPAPDVIHEALRQAECEPSEAIMLGDTPYDVVAATEAGVRIVAVRSGGWSTEELSGAAAVYDDPADLLRNFDDSPFMVG